MKIVEVDVCPLSGATVDGGWPQGHEPQENLHALICVKTEDGIVGWGSCFTSGSLVAASMELLWPLLKHENALEPERVSELLHQSTFWQGRGGAVTHAISGIDIALWDILGKVCQQPVGRLLGGCYRNEIPVYASILFDQPEALADRLQEVTAAGFKAIKMGWRPFGRHDAAFDERLICTARRAVGDDIQLMVDAGGSEQFWPHGLKWALRTADMLADYQIAWFEEPLAPDDLEGFVQLTRQARLPITGGEVLTRRQSFEPFLRQQAFDIVQPDVTKCGGLSEFRRTAQMAQDHHVEVVPHGWNTVVGLAADLQLSAFLPNASYVEYLTPSAYIDDLTIEPPQMNAVGSLSIPQTPGLGIAIDEEKLRRYCAERIRFQ